MPKIKTSSSAKKRFKVTAGGKLLRRQAMQSHNLEKKSPKRKRSLIRARLDRSAEGQIMPLQISLRPFEPLAVCCGYLPQSLIGHSGF